MQLQFFSFLVLPKISVNFCFPHHVGCERTTPNKTLNTNNSVRIVIKVDLLFWKRSHLDFSTNKTLMKTISQVFDNDIEHSLTKFERCLHKIVAERVVLPLTAKCSPLQLSLPMSSMNIRAILWYMALLWIFWLVHFCCPDQVETSPLKHREKFYSKQPRVPYRTTSNFDTNKLT